jgi:hypothetical protein
MIFSTADGANAGFTSAMKRYAEQLSAGKYEMRTLPRNHLLFSKELGVELPNPPPLQGVSNGVRELWIHSPQDVGADWHARKFASKNSFELGAALYFYASGMGSLRSKLQPLAVAAKNTDAPGKNLNVARIDYAGNSDPEPGAWARFAKLAKANANVDVKTALTKFADLDPKKFPLAHLTGTASVTFTADEAKALKAYLDGGGLLFIDAAGGSNAFVTSCQELLKQVYPNQSLKALAPDHPIYTGTPAGGAKVGEVDFRKYGNTTLKRRVISPAIEEIAIDGKTKVLLSQWDICSGFLGTNTWGIVGYAPATAETLGRNIVLYAHEQAVK